EPSKRWGMKAVYDPEADGMWMYGGWDYTYSQQLWFLEWSQQTVAIPIANTQAQAFADHAALEWQLPAKARTSAMIQRSTDGVHWTNVGMRLPTGLMLPFADRGVAAGGNYAWRVVVAAPGKLMVSTPVSLTIPAPTDSPRDLVRFGLMPAGLASQAG